MDFQVNQTRIRCLCLLIVTFSVIIFSACTTQQSTQREQISATKTATPQPNQTDLPPELSITPSATPIIQAVTDVTVRYVNNLDELPAVDGKLAITIDGLAYLDNLSKNEQILLGDLYWWYSLPFYDCFSPDREKMIMHDPKGQTYLVDTNGNITQQLKQVSPTSEIVGWLNNEWVIAVDDWDSKEYYWLEFTILMNIHSNEIVTLEPVYPDFGTLATNWGNNLTIYHPQDPLVVYPAVKNKLSSINIFDREKQKVLAEFPALIGETQYPQWSPDGKYLLLAGKLNNIGQGKDEEIYLVDTDGRVVFKTLFANHIPQEEFESFLWSPSSQKIAFWIWGVRPKYYQLAILDVNSGIVTQYDLFIKPRNNPTLHWSPDSQFVAIQQVMDDHSRKYTILHLDYGTAYEYFETDTGSLLAGWVK